MRSQSDNELSHSGTVISSQVVPFARVCPALPVDRRSGRSLNELPDTGGVGWRPCLNFIARSFGSLSQGALARTKSVVYPIVARNQPAETLLERIAPVTLRWALGVTLLSAVARPVRPGGPPGAGNISWGNWARFVAYTAQVNSFEGIVASLTMLDIFKHPPVECRTWFLSELRRGRQQ